MAPASSIIVSRHTLEFENILTLYAQAKLKVQLKLSIARLRMVQQKDEAVTKQQRRAMAQLLEAGKIESAKIRTENIIRSDITTELHEILELYCELLLARTGLMEAATCDAGLEEAVKSLIYAAPRTDIKELQQVRALLMEKYGKEFALQAMENSDEKVSEKVLKKLRVEPPSPELVEGYLIAIAETYGVDYPKGRNALGAPPEFEDDDDDENPSGGQAQKNLEEPLMADRREEEEQAALSKATPPRDFGPKSPLRVNPPNPSTDNLHPQVKGTSTLNLRQTQKTQDATTKKAPLTSKGAVGGTIPDVDELAKRFAALKK